MKQVNIISQDKVKDVLITKTAIANLKPEGIVEKIVNYQFKGAAEATKHCNEVEISGLGKFQLSYPRVRKKLKVLHRTLMKIDRMLPTAPPEKVVSLTKQRKSASTTIDELIKKYLR